MQIDKLLLSSYNELTGKFSCFSDIVNFQYITIAGYLFNNYNNIIYSRNYLIKIIYAYSYDGQNVTINNVPTNKSSYFVNNPNISSITICNYKFIDNKDGTITDPLNPFTFNYNPTNTTINRPEKSSC